ncbi:MAG: anion permease [Armatimonadetes bacterium CG_4_10_14_3_um_filter_66_18]|nr:inorganic phosphate transporter [Armatimonadota bacterium]OIO91656.1 MAG: anion permease [Armatimonadetes bacterium CG2_30_66_41]PIU94149.1 MAG: anion permease [Armatimonadetes bacterium CG06_land_8_20_14_3_00_66_21]PIX50116.1 MAG: anion permease [Armatimonadetes bacterium CG_4_8_14_3_um_filter_66_20]PIY46559.1 MAG: anion permease [Armatimonadetes bacterium CG_4_10_14_3_um_filter_66_18]PIZ31389.1 MAG: anion permease [Armatimonadetes bacterium CG_4_10_14_0_8_um_filter_66_14]PJB62199.1 MAG: 
MDNPWVWGVVLLGLTFEFVNGFHDAANAIATSVLTRALTIRSAVLMCAVLNFLGALSSKAVATTIGKGIVSPQEVTHTVVASALVGAIVWDVITWRLGLPTSSTHAIVGGIIGASAGYKGWSIIHLAGTQKVFIGLILSPLVGVLGALVLMTVFLWVFGRQPPSTVNRRFRLVQVASAGLMAFSHGSNDGQKSMGIIAMALAAGAAMVHSGALAGFEIPTWVMVSCALAMALGSGAGGWRIIKTLGRGVMELQPIHGCVAELTAATIILTASHVGAPISTTHTISATIMGVGVSRRLSAVKWKVVGNIVWAWILTMPASALVAFLCVKLLVALGE